MSTQPLKTALWIFLSLFAVTSIALAAIDMGLRNDTTPHGIVSFEFCAFTSSCDYALIEWGSKGQALAMLSLGIDYLYLVLYPGLIFIGLLLVAPRVPHKLFKPTMYVARSCLLISLADAIENYALIQLILSEPASVYGLLGGIFATIKFLFLGITLSWLLFITLRYLLIARPGV